MADGSWLKSRLSDHGIATIVPEDPGVLARCYEIIVNELSFNVLTEESRQYFIAVAREMVGRGAEGVILGCTEIELLVKERDAPDLVLFASAHLHMKAAAQVQCGLRTCESYGA